MNAVTLAKLGKSILSKIDTKKTRGLNDDLEAFVHGLAFLDGRISPSFPSSTSRWSASDLSLVRKYVSIELRNTLEGDSPTSVPELSEGSNAIEALENRLIVVARTDFNVFVEMVATATNEKRKRVPVVQARIHRRWTQICDDPTNERVIIISHNEAGKSQQLAIWRPLFDLGRDPTLKMVVLTNTAGSAVSRIRSIADFITTEPMVRKIFPHLKPDPAGPWNTTQLKVVRPGIDKEPSIEAFGLKGAILGSRVDRIYADDLLDSENTATPKQIEDLNSWWMANVETRLTTGCRVIIVGTPWRPEDLLHVLEGKKEDYQTFRFPILDAAGNCTWPEAWTDAKVAQRRRLLPALEWSRSMMCVARSNEAGAFKEEHIRAAIARGEGHPRGPAGVPDGAKIFIGVDLAASQKKTADDSAVYALAFEKNGGKYTTLSIEAGKWTPGELIARLWEHQDRYSSRGEVSIHVESNGAQTFFVSQARAAGLSIREFVTSGANKHDALSGIEAQSTVFRDGLWTIPSTAGGVDPEVSRWVQELLFYDRGKHAGDRLMAGWISFASAKAYAAIRPVAEVGIRIISEHGDELQNARDREERARVSKLEEDARALLPSEEPGVRRPSSNPNMPDRDRFPESPLHRAFDVPSEPAPVDEWTARERLRNGYRGDETPRSAERSAKRLADGTIANDNGNADEAVRNVGHWWTGGGVKKGEHTEGR